MNEFFSLHRNCIAARDPYCGWTKGSTCSFLRVGTRYMRRTHHRGYGLLTYRILSLCTCIVDTSNARTDGVQRRMRAKLVVLWKGDTTMSIKQTHSNIRPHLKSTSYVSARRRDQSPGGVMKLPLRSLSDNGTPRSVPVLSFHSSLSTMTFFKMY